MRCFIGCWPDSQVRERLDRLAADALAQHAGARRMRADNLHLTLAFIGELAPDKVHEAAARLAAHRVAALPLAWRIDRVGHFARARVLWAGGPPHPALSNLADEVRDLLTGLRIRFDTKPFVAHVTLLRDLPRAAADEATSPVDPFEWPIASARVVLSERDASGATRYRPLDDA